MAHAGAFLAKQNAEFICFAQNNSLCVPLITAINNAGGKITIFTEQGFKLPSGLAKIATKTLSQNKDTKLKQIGNSADAFIGLPSSISSVKLLLDSWVATDRKKPVALLNKNRNFEFIRGFATEVANVKVKELDKYLLLSDNIEDLWHRLSKIVKS